MESCKTKLMSIQIGPVRLAMQITLSASEAFMYLVKTYNAFLGGGEGALQGGGGGAVLQSENRK